MGVDVSTYLFYGIKLDLKKLKKEIETKFPDFDGGHYEFLEAEIDGSKEAEFDAIADHMSGKYIILGKEIASTTGWDEKFYELKLEDLPDRAAMIGKINTRLKASYTQADFKLFFFNHFS